jgi:hypothetical protein
LLGGGKRLPAPRSNVREGTTEIRQAPTETIGGHGGVFVLVR